MPKPTCSSHTLDETSSLPTSSLCGHRRNPKTLELHTNHWPLNFSLDECPQVVVASANVGGIGECLLVPQNPLLVLAGVASGYHYPSARGNIGKYLVASLKYSNKQKKMQLGIHKFLVYLVKGDEKDEGYEYRIPG